MLPSLMPVGPTAQFPMVIVAKELARDTVAEAKPTIRFYAHPVDGPTTTRLRQENLAVT